MWNKQAFTEADLDAIVQAFHDASLAGRIPLKFGHGDTDSDQPFREGLPALGWVSKLWRAGKALMADFTDIPGAVYDSIKSGAYKYTSIELLKNAEYDGKRFPYLLDAVALLGADPPAVHGLQDLQKLALSRESLSFAEALQFTATTKPIHFSGDRKSMTPEEIQAAIAKGVAEATKVNKQAADEAAAELAKFKRETQEAADAKTTEMKKFKEENDKLKLQVETQAAAVKAEKIKLSRDSAKAILEAGVRAKKITPASRLLYTKLLKIDDDEAVLELDMKDVEAVAGLSQEEATRVMGAGKSAFSRSADDKSGSALSDEEADREFKDEFTKRVFEHAAKTGKSTFASMADVVRLDPKLGRQFTNFVFENGDAA